MFTEKAPVWSASFLLTEQEFLDYNLLMTRLQRKKRRTQSFWVGLTEVIVSGAYLLFSLFMRESRVTLLMVFAALLLILGLGNLFFTPFLIKRQLQRTVRETYEKSEYLNNPITLSFYEEGFLESSKEGSGEVYWQDVQEIVEGKDFFRFSLSAHRSVILPKRVLSAEQYAQATAFFQKIQSLQKQ